MIQRLIDLQADTAATADHGTLGRYVSGKCRCAECRFAVAAYERERRLARARGEGNGIVPASDAKHHLERLVSRGYSLNQIALRADTNVALLRRVLAGGSNIRALVSGRILKVKQAKTKRSRGVPAEKTKQMLRELMARGYSMSQLARWLWGATYAANISRLLTCSHVRKSTEQLVRVLCVWIETGKLRRS
jgi:hypothetical protein